MDLNRRGSLKVFKFIYVFFARIDVEDLLIFFFLLDVSVSQHN